MAPASAQRASDSLFAVAGLSKGGIYLGDRIFLHARQDVAVEIEGHADLGMPEAFARYLRVNASS